LTFKSIHKAKNGLTVESGAVNVAANEDKQLPAYLRGFSKISYKAPWGDAEGELHTDAEQTSKVQSKFTKLYPGASFLLSWNSKDKYDLFKGVSSIVSAEATYQQQYVNSSLALKTDLHKKAKGDATLALGYDNWSVGGGVTVSHNDGNQDVDELHGGVEYSQEDLTVSAYSNTDKKTKFWNASVFHKVNRDLLWGAKWKYDTTQSSHAVTIGSDLRIDQDTGFKSNLELPTGKLQLAVEYRLSNPQLLLGVASEYNVSKPEAPVAKKLGFSFTVGEF